MVIVNVPRARVERAAVATADVIRQPVIAHQALEIVGDALADLELLLVLAGRHAIRILRPEAGRAAARAITDGPILDDPDRLAFAVFRMIRLRIGRSSRGDQRNACEQSERFHSPPMVARTV